MTYRQILELAEKHGTYMGRKFAKAAIKAASRNGKTLDDLAL